MSPPAALSVSAVFGLWFARSFLSSAARMPVVDRILLGLVLGWGLALLAALSLPYTVSSYMITVLALVSVVTMAFVGWISIRREVAGARYFFTAWALLLLGVGWNFVFTGATTLSLTAYRPEEKDRAQAVLNLIVFLTLACSSLASGVLVTTQGWTWLNLGSVLPVVLIAAGLFALGRSARWSASRG